MRNLCKYIIASVALVVSALSFGSVALAQQAPVIFDKYVSGPNEKGVFTINLEAYAPGSISVVKKPFDIVLVLDRSGSMEDNLAGSSTNNPKNMRINILKTALQGFVDNLKNTDVDAEFRDEYGGHRIAFVWFSGSANNQSAAVVEGTGLNEFQKVENLSTIEASGNGSSYQAAQVLLNNTTNLIGVDPDGGTYSNTAMQRARTILSQQNYSDKPNRSRMVIFFTDGVPGRGTYGWQEDNAISTANGCIQAAYYIKNSTDYKATIYSVGLFNNITNANQTTTYLAYTSSDYPTSWQMPNYTWNNVNVSNLYSLLVSNSEQLNTVFTTIAQNTSSAASASSVLVDIVTSDFSIPTGTDLGSVTVWEVPCTQESAGSPISFSPPRTGWQDITSSVTLKTHANDPQNTPEGQVSVTGFDYGANWCGWDASVGAAHGSKLVLEIPITVDDNIVGGPNTKTNLSGSGIIVKNASGEEIGHYYFPIPVVKVPVTIWIKKEGLLSSTKNSAVQGHEDNAVFTIRKTKFLGLYETNSAGEVFEGAKRIEYTYSKTENKKFIVKGVETEIKWTTFTKVSVNMTMKEGDQYGIVKISGLDADYIYRIEEDAWAHLGYDFDPDATARYTLEWNGTEYVEPTNPFVFGNTPKTNAFYSEDVVRNVFNQGSAAPTTTP